MEQDPFQEYHNNINMLAADDPEVVQELQPQEGPTSAERVLGNEMLLDNILKFAIYDQDMLHPPTLNNCKLVKRQWFERVTAIAYKKDTSSPVKLNIIVDPSRVKNFLRTFKDLPAKRIAPCSLEISHAEDNAQANVCSLSKQMQQDCMACFTRCGERLVTLKMDCFPAMWSRLKKPSPCHPDAAPGRFPRLEEICIKEYLKHNKCQEGIDKSKTLIGWILDGTECLRSFTLEQDEPQDREYNADDIWNSNLNLPNTITEIRLFSYIEKSQRYLEQIVQNLSHLTSLGLSGPAEGQEALHYRILDRLRHQLKKLEIRDQAQHQIALPVMERVEELVYSGSRWYRDDALRGYFPVLKEISLSTPEYDVMQKWLKSGVSSTVRRVSVEFDFEDIPEGRWPELNLMFYLKDAFPNLIHLSLAIPLSREFPCVKYIFNQMKQLEILELGFLYCHTYCNLGNAFNANLLATSVQEVVSLEEQRRHWNNMNWIFEDLDTWSSISEMRELKELRLSAGSINPAGPRLNLDVVMQFAFFRMSKLQHLVLNKNIEISEDMAQSWRGQGRILKFQN